LYGRDLINRRKPAYDILPRHSKATDFRWIHIPTNNISWIEDLLAKVFIEEGADDVEGYMDLQQSLSYQHGGKLAHSRFMTPACRITTRAQKSADDELSEDATTEQGPPEIIINSRTDVESKTGRATKPGRRNPSRQVSNSNIFFCMPYLHYETDSRRCEMHGAIKRAELLKNGIHSTKAITYDEMMIRAYLVTQNSSLHVRRTLDQSFYHNIDTQTRDRDQVVYRYQLKRNKADSIDPKIFMVDQLWMWTLGKDLIVTSFPQRWQQAKNDPMNVLDNIIETITSRRREPVRTVHDLAMTITECCLAVYDRLCVGDNAFQFLDMFESTLGDATDRGDLLFKEFSVASLQASAWLQQRHQRPDRMLEHGTKEAASANIFERFQLVDPNSDALFVDKLLDISQETMLLAEIKDIRDELNMMAIIFETQRQVLPELEMIIADIYREQHRSQQSVKKPLREQLRNIEMRVKEIERMDKQAERVYMSVIDLLDLKQKQDANAFEGRMARNQAESTARQSQIIMVFTIVTIIFLPLNFIAAVFAINIREFPRDPNQDGSLPLAYVSKYTFGIGFAVSVPMIAIALSLDGITKSFSEMKRVWSERWSRRRTKNVVRDQEDGREPTDLDWTLLVERRTLSNSHAYEHCDRASREDGRSAPAVRPRHRISL
jgi:Mg2+ and Co2+ transporter CorA